jgi:HK97 family phage major capsid protein
MTALRARPFEGFEKDPPERSFLELIEKLHVQTVPPWQELKNADRGFEISEIRFRDLSMLSGPAGAYLAKGSQPRTFAEAMIAASVCGKAGAKVVQPEGDWSAIPVVTEVGELAWVGPDGATISETPMTFGSRSRRPRLGVFSVNYTRNLRVVTGGLADRAILSEGARTVAAGIDKAAIQGSGVNDEPLGILSAPVQTTSGATFSTTTAAEMLRLLEVSKAVPSAFLISPATAKVFRTRPRFTDSDTPLLTGGIMMDLPVYVSTSVPDAVVIAGDFSRLTICVESVQILVNPYVGSEIGKISATIYQFTDVVLEHASAFCVATEVS